MNDVIARDEPASESLARRFAAWNSDDIGGQFADSAADLRDRLAEAMRSGDFDHAAQARTRITELFAMEPGLRRGDMLSWLTLRRLAEARLLAACLLAPADREGALRMLRDQTRWCKQTLGVFPLDTPEDFDEASQFVFTAQLSYLIAHRYVRPEDRHVADRGIPEDFARTFGRVFGDEELQRQVIALMERLSMGD